MPSPVDICNLALAHVGDQSRVASIEPPEASVQAKACALFYPIARDTALGNGHAWSFATRRISPASVDSITSAPPWQYAYAVPADCLAPLAILDPLDQAGDPHEVE